MSSPVLTTEQLVIIKGVLVPRCRLSLLVCYKARNFDMAGMLTFFLYHHVNSSNFENSPFAFFLVPAYC